MSKIAGVLVDVINNEIKKVTIDNTVDELHRILNCKRIDIISRKIRGVKVRIVCDDCALFKKDATPSIIFFPNEVIFGNSFICDFDGIDDLCSLSDEDIQQVLSGVAYTKQKVLFSMEKWEI